LLLVVYEKTMGKILIDIGSSTVKVYRLYYNSPKLVLSRSIFFKEGFDSNKGIADNKKEELYEVISQVKKEYPKTPIKLYATALYRKMTPEAKKAFIDEFFAKTGLFFNIIEHDLESFYLQVALVGKYSNAKKPLLLINIGGGSTELVVVSEGKAIESHNVNIGVGTVLTEFEGVNAPVSKIELRELVEAIKGRIPAIKNKVRLAFYSGGELDYMRVAGYKLQQNSLFEDKDHPELIFFEDFAKRNEEIFKKLSLKKLEKMMPKNPKWMHGARACSALAQAICEKYKIEIIIPSNSNLIDGVARQEFRRVTISGSFRKRCFSTYRNWLRKCVGQKNNFH
jgi:hypothetical protein